MIKQYLVGFCLLMASLGVLADTPEDPQDPWEGLNRSIFAFNETLDRYALKPLAKGYDFVTPSPVQKGVSNFFSNLGEVPNVFNNMLQGKWDGMASSTFRFMVNTTAGFAGVFDVASEMGLQRYDEDFGQTLGYWGVDSGPYLVLPFFGPSTVRDASGMVVDYSWYNAMELYDFSESEQWRARGINVVQIRAKYLSSERLVFGDRYSFLRDVYIQTREGKVKDNIDNANQEGTSDDASTSPVEQGDSWGADDQDSWGEDSWGEDSWGESDQDSWGEDSWSE